MKRFYDTVEVAATDAGPFTVTLDGRVIQTPARNPLEVPQKALALGIRDEWDQQTEEIDPGHMPLMRFAATALDRVAANRDDVIDEITGFGASDLLCHRAEGPAELVDRQNAIWQPLLDWANTECGADLTVTTGIMPVNQSEAAMTAVRSNVAQFNDLKLSGLHSITVTTGSVVIGLAVTHGRLNADDAWIACQVDEAFQIEQWGEDEENNVRRAALQQVIHDAANFLALCED